VGGLPPAGRPSGACLARGTPILLQASARRRGCPHTGAAALPLHGGTPAALRGQWRGGLQTDVRSGTCGARAPMHPARSQAMAPGTTLPGVPRAPRRRSRCQRLRGAGPRMSWSTLGGCARRHGRGRLPVAGYGSAQAPATSPRRAWVCPAVGRAPGWRRSPVAYAEGTRPYRQSLCLGSKPIDKNKTTSEH
jgi:hypothetical protein